MCLESVAGECIVERVRAQYKDKIARLKTSPTLSSSGAREALDQKTDSKGHRSTNF